MHAIRTNVTRLLWIGLGAGAVLAAGCTGGHMAHTMTAPVTLAGSQEVPPVNTTASGVSDISVGESKCPSAGSSSNCPTVSGVISTKGIIGTAAHIHRGAPGQNGPVVVSLVKIDDSTWQVPSGTVLNDALNEAYWGGQLYVNVHSAANPGGEIRAQLKP